MYILNILILIFTILSCSSWIYSLFVFKCPEQKIVYKEPPIPLDIQFGTTNFPSNLYNNIFTGPNPWMGGYKLPADEQSRQFRTTPSKK